MCRAVSEQYRIGNRIRTRNIPETPRRVCILYVYETGRAAVFIVRFVSSRGASGLRVIRSFCRGAARRLRHDDDDCNNALYIGCSKSTLRPRKNGFDNAIRRRTRSVRSTINYYNTQIYMYVRIYIRVTKYKRNARITRRAVIRRNPSRRLWSIIVASANRGR